MESTTPEATPGELLKRARLARGASLQDVAQALKLSLLQVGAIEESKFDVLPGPTFVRGFVRNYARLMDLDPAPLLAGLDTPMSVNLTPVSNARGNIPNGENPRASALPAMIVVTLLLLIAAGLYFGWFKAQPEEVPVDVPVLETPAPLPDESDAETPIESPDTAPAPAPDAAAEPAPVAPAATVSTPAATSTLRFSFATEAWIEVREGKDGSGKILYSGSNPAGSTRSIQGKPPFSLKVGNAREVKLEFNGKPVDLTPHITASVARLTLQ
jgi:cytoskeleton protein RodZ